MALNPDFTDLFAAFNAARVKPSLPLSRDLRLTAHRLAARPKGLDHGPDSRGALAPAARDSSPLGDSSRCERGPGPPGGLSVPFAEAWSDRQETQYSDQKVPVIGLGHLDQEQARDRSATRSLDAEEFEKN